MRYIVTLDDSVGLGIRNLSKQVSQNFDKLRAWISQAKDQHGWSIWFAGPESRGLQRWFDKNLRKCIRIYLYQNYDRQISIVGFIGDGRVAEYHIDIVKGEIVDIYSLSGNPSLLTIDDVLVILSSLPFNKLDHS